MKEEGRFRIADNKLKKGLLYDDFTCRDEGALMGQVDPDVINMMRKGN